jgi:hypothetical protein
MLSKDVSIDKIEFVTVHSKDRLKLKLTLRIGRVECANNTSSSTIWQCCINDRTPPVGNACASENSFESIVSHREYNRAIRELLKLPLDHTDPAIKFVSVDNMPFVPFSREADLPLDDVSNINVCSIDAERS